MNEIDLTIVVPIYNVENYLNECLKSITEVKHIDDWEIILINDGSTDSSLEIAEAYAEVNQNIKIITQNNQGLSGARNTGIKYANGKYILFVDSDDFIDIVKVEHMLKIAKEKDIDFLSGQCSVFIDSDLQIENRKSVIIKCDNLPYNEILNTEEFLLGQINNSRTFQTMVVLNLYKLEILKKNNLYFLNGFLHEDEEWTPKVILHCESFMCLDDVFYFYRKRLNSITTKKKENKNFDDLKKIRLITEKLYTEKVTNKELKSKLLDNLVKRKIFDYYICNNMHAKKEKSFFERNTFSNRNKLASFLIMYFPQVYIFLKKLNGKRGEL